MSELVKVGPILPGLLIEMVVAIVCGGLIGLERGTSERVTGLRENILICLGTVLFVDIADMVEGGSGGFIALARFAALGVGVISAGVVIQAQGKAGLAGAAKLWVVAMIGLIIGSGQWLLGMLVTGLILLVLTLLHGIERGLAGRVRGMMLKLTVREDSEPLRRKLRELLEKHGVQVVSFRAEPGPLGMKITLQCSPQPEDVRPLIGSIWTLPGVIEVEH